MSLALDIDGIDWCIRSAHGWDRIGVSLKKECRISIYRGYRYHGLIHQRSLWLTFVLFYWMRFRKIYESDDVREVEE